MPTRSTLASYLPNFLLARFKRNSPCFILRLPLDIHVDQVFVHLCIEDIICLRRVNKAFFLLTHEPIIWKRFLERMNIPVPPMRPSFRYSLQATDFEVEQLVTRAISLDDNWRQIYPNVCSRHLMMAHYQVLDMKLLPGGKFLVASVKDSSNYHFYIVIFTLDHPKGPRALARVPTHVKAFHLQAKYMKHNGVQGVMIAYVRRTFRDGPQPGLDASDYSYKFEVEAPFPFAYESICEHISLESLEALADPQLVPGSREYLDLAANQPPPFTQVAYLEAERHTDCLTLFEYNEFPYLAVVQQPDEVVVIDLTARVISTLVCNPYEAYPDKPHRILATRALPGQRDILVIRSIEIEPAKYPEPATPYRPAVIAAPAVNIYVVEIYDAPCEAGGFTERDPKDLYVIEDRRVSGFHISDYGIPSTSGDQPTLRHTSGPPPPISIFFRTLDPIGVIHHVLWPAHVEIPATLTQAAKTVYYYSLDHVVPQTKHVSSPHVTHILPGAYRALMYTVPTADRSDTPALIRLRRYINPEIQHADYPLPKEDTSEPILRKKRRALPFNVYGTFDLPRHVKQLYQEEGVAAITWDEGIGRVCIAAKDEMNIRILDFAHVVQPDARFAQWKRSQAYLHSE